MEEIKNSIESLWQIFNKMSSKEVDDVFHIIAQEEENKIDCTECGKCCKSLQPAFTDVDVKRIQGVCSNVKEFLTEENSKENVFYLKKSPCTFLKGTICSIYDERPASCADYPHLQLPNIKYRKRSIKDNYMLCPIVYNSVESLLVKLT